MSASLKNILQYHDRVHIQKNIFKKSNEKNLKFEKLLQKYFQEKPKKFKVPFL